MPSNKVNFCTSRFKVDVLNTIEVGKAGLMLLQTARLLVGVYRDLEIVKQLLPTLKHKEFTVFFEMLRNKLPWYHIYPWTVILVNKNHVNSFNIIQLRVFLLNE